MSVYNSSFTQEELKQILSKCGCRVHFCGMLGAGMSPLAALFCSHGYSVSGSDMSVAKGECTYQGSVRVTSPAEENIRDKDAVIYTLALSEDDAEFSEAAKLGIPLISRAQALGYIMCEYRERIGISGSHGKSTTTAALDRILSLAHMGATSVSGAKLSHGSHLTLGTGDTFVYEACEYKDSFLHTHPTVAVINNIELDHTDYFSDIDSVIDSFLAFADSADRIAIINIDSPASASLVGLTKSRAVTFGRAESADFRYDILSTGEGICRFSVYFMGRHYADFMTELIGEYNVSNLTGAIAAAYLLGVDKEHIAEGVRTFCGIERRFSRLGTLDGRDVIYDYAHHPTEIKNVISAARERYKEITVVFRPHTYTRTKSLWCDFVTALGMADHVILTDIFAAREAPINGISSQRLAEDIGGGAVCLPDREVAGYVRRSTGGAVIIMGAGDMESVILEIKKENDKK